MDDEQMETPQQQGGIRSGSGLMKAILERNNLLSDPQNKLMLDTGFIIGCIFTAFFSVFVYSIYVFFSSINPPLFLPLNFQIHSFNATNSNSNWTATALLSAQNPLPFTLHAYIAKASISYYFHVDIDILQARNHLATPVFIDPFFVKHTTATMLSARLSSPASSVIATGVDGFEFRVDALVKIDDGGKVGEKMASMKVVCGNLKMNLSSADGLLLDGPKKCLQSWGSIC